MRIMGLCFMVAVMSIPAFALVINDFEGAAGNAIDWSDELSVDGNANYSYDSVSGVTSGSQSLHLSNITGWGHTLALRLDYDQRVAFMANSIFSIDISAPANHVAGGGWTEVYSVTLNAEGFAWSDVIAPVAAQFGFWDNSPVQTRTLTFDYSAAKASMPAVPGWVEIVFATNSDGTHTNLYFDNAQLLVPEPASVTLLGLGLLGLLRKRR